MCTHSTIVVAVMAPVAMGQTTPSRSCSHLPQLEGAHSTSCVYGCTMTTR